MPTNPLMNPMYQKVNQRGNAFTGYSPQLMTTSPFAKPQISSMQQLLGMGMQGLQQGRLPGAGFNFAPIAASTQERFHQNVLPSIAERFSALGGENKGSSGLLGQMAGAESMLSQNLAGMEQQFNMEQLPYIMQMLGLGLTPQYEQQYLPGQSGFLRSGTEGLLGGLGYGLGSGGFNPISWIKGLFTK